ncbi:MAG: SUMF1/EgtB/PvdO family nonheme iron enzyme [Spirochaetes bacterium]|nr:SUMF1/EgtB/PvdO family nonheme iron enzyme [Spirochaetota bacterium]MBU1079307.1 SUMF1/EgtB/PvdO family nonheme iron enzyme [Spirochaetota bacterium]
MQYKSPSRLPARDAAARYPLIAVSILAMIFSCRSPVQPGGYSARAARADFTLGFIVSGSSVAAATAAASGNGRASPRLLLPTAVSLTVRLEPSVDGLSSADPQTVAMEPSADGSARASVTFRDVVAGEYAITAEAKDASGDVAFRQSSTIDLRSSSGPVTLSLVPAVSVPMPALIGEQADFALAAGASETFIVPPSVFGGTRGMLSPASSDIVFFIQSMDGTLLDSGAADDAVVADTLPEDADLYLTVYNRSAGPVTVHYRAAYSVRYAADPASGISASVDFAGYLSGSPVVVKKTAIRGAAIRDGITERLDWNTAANGSGTAYAQGQSIIMGRENITLYPIWTTTVNPASDSVLGKIGPAGGVVFYDQGSVVGGWRYLEAAPSDLSSSAPWAPGADIAVAAANNAACGTGMANTSAIIQAAGDAGTYAAKLCADYSVNGYGDWYLPTDIELSLMYTNVHAKGLGDFAGGKRYWTSINNDDLNAWEIEFVPDNPGKVSSVQAYTDRHTRAIRAFRSGNPTYTVTYYPNGSTSGSAPVDVAGYEAGDAITVKGKPGSLIKAGSAFGGWNAAANGSGTTYGEGSTLTIASSDVRLYASWLDESSPYIGALSFVPAGSFQYSASPADLSTLTRPYLMAKHEITRSQYLAVMGADPSLSAYSSNGASSPDDPVQNVNWYMAIAFCNRLSIAEGLTPVYSVAGVDFNTLIHSAIPTAANDAAWEAVTTSAVADGYRIPTSLQWMWAAMGATSDRSNGYTGTGANTTGYAKGYAGSSELGAAQANVGSYAWYDANSGGKTHPVGTAGGGGYPNELDIFDMSGNVEEIVRDRPIAIGAVTDFDGGTNGSSYLFGAAFKYNAAKCALNPYSNNTNNHATFGEAYGIRVIRYP